MNLLARKLQLFSLVVCSTFMAVTSVPQVISADPSSAKLSGIKEIVATSGFWGGAPSHWGLTEPYGLGGAMFLDNLQMKLQVLKGGRLLPSHSSA